MKETQPALVSVIIPVYGVQAYLPRCIDSVLHQSFQNIEIILVDDGSPDDCPAICDRYAAEYSQIRVIHKKNGGVSSARNAGLEAVTGTYVTFLDSDDCYEPQWIQNLTAAMEESQADVVVANHQKVLPDGTRQPMTHEPGVYVQENLRQQLSYMITYVMTDRHAWEITTRLFKTEIIKKQKIRFCESCGNFAEDLGFVLAYSLYCRKVVSVEEAGYCYCIRENSMMVSSRQIPRLDSSNEVSMEFLSRFGKTVPEEVSGLYGPVFHFLIMLDQYLVAISCSDYRDIGTYLDTIQRYEEWKEETEKIFACGQLLEALFGKIPAGRILIYSRYLLHRNYLRFKIQRFLFFKWNHYRD